MAERPDGTWKGLDHDDNERAIRRDWRFERIGRVIFGVLLLAGLAGAFGHGPLAEAHATAGALRLDYTRLERRGAPARLRFSLPAAAVPDTVMHLWVDRRWVDEVRVERVMPEPREVREWGRALVYEFATSRHRPALVTFEYEHEHQWVRRGSAGVVGGDSVRFAQFVYP